MFQHTLRWLSAFPKWKSFRPGGEQSWSREEADPPGWSYCLPRHSKRREKDIGNCLPLKWLWKYKYSSLLSPLVFICWSPFSFFWVGSKRPNIRNVCPMRHPCGHAQVYVYIAMYVRTWSWPSTRHPISLYRSQRCYCMAQVHFGCIYFLNTPKLWWSSREQRWEIPRC